MGGRWCFEACGRGAELNYWSKEGLKCLHFNVGRMLDEFELMRTFCAKTFICFYLIFKFSVYLTSNEIKKQSSACNRKSQTRGFLLDPCSGRKIGKKAAENTVHSTETGIIVVLHEPDAGVVFRK